MTPPNAPVHIIGVGMTRFVKPQSKNDYAEMGFEAGVKALLDAHINYDNIDRAVASYCYGDSTCGQRILYQLGMTGIPIYNVNNNCASGSTAMAMARDFIKSGQSDCVLVVGFEKMGPGSLGSNFRDRTDPLDRATAMSRRIAPGSTSTPFAAQMFANAAQEYIKRFGATPADFAEVARVNHAHSQHNPYSQFRTTYTADEIASAAMVADPLTKLQCCPTSDGAAAAVLCSQSFLNSHPALKPNAVEILGQCLSTDTPALYSGSAIALVGHETVSRCAASALAEADKAIADVGLVELHDCFSANEILVIDALGLSAPGKAHEFVRAGRGTYGPAAAAVVNPSGGLISKGHPLGATGIAQHAELAWQLRGWAGARHVGIPAGRVALQQNAGLGGACVVTVLARSDGKGNAKVDEERIREDSGAGYNPAVEARGFTREHADRVCSRRMRSGWAVGGGKGEGRGDARV